MNMGCHIVYALDLREFNTTVGVNTSQYMLPKVRHRQGRNGDKRDRI